MRAVLYATHGGPEVLQMVDVPDPEPRVDEVVIAVRAAALNRLDALQRQGPPLLQGFTLPHVPGMDVAGEVVASGIRVEALPEGTRVLVKPRIACGSCVACRRGDDRGCTHVQVVGGSRWGGYADYCVVPASHVYELPASAEYEEAATVPTALSTAWRALVDTARVRMGDVVVIHGPGSGVSIMALQLAKRAGAVVIVTGRSKAKLERARQLGADYVLPETDGHMVEAVLDLTRGRGADVVLNHVGTALFSASLAMLGMDGRLVTGGTTTGARVELDLPRVYSMGIQILGLGRQSARSFVDALDHYWAGGYQAVIDSRFDLETAALAHERLESGETFGKVILTP